MMSKFNFRVHSGGLTCVLIVFNTLFSNTDFPDTTDFDLMASACPNISVGGPMDVPYAKSGPNFKRWRSKIGLGLAWSPLENISYTSNFCSDLYQSLPDNTDFDLMTSECPHTPVDSPRDVPNRQSRANFDFRGQNSAHLNHL